MDGRGVECFKIVFFPERQKQAQMIGDNEWKRFH